MKKDINMKLALRTLLIPLLIMTMVLPSFAMEKETNKEEIVYGMLHEDGLVNEIYIVNIFEGKGNINDYGDYSQIRNMTSEDTIHSQDDLITINNSNEKLYYEGKLKQNKLPWELEIQYFIDGKKYPAKEIAGMSGNLEIKIKIKENKEVNEFFFQNYALQINLVFDTDKSTNIIAEDATIANIGKNKQLTYTILPNKGADISVKSTVKDFEMEAMSINGINLNLGLDIDNNELKDKLSEITDVIDKFDQGATDLNNGASKIKDGSIQLTQGVKNIESGASELNSGTSSLVNGLEKVETALIELDNKSIHLTDGSLQFKNIINEVSKLIKNLSIDIKEIEKLNGASSEIKKGFENLNFVINELNDNVNYGHYKNTVKEQGLDIDQLKAGNEQALTSLIPMIDKIDEISQHLEESDVPGIQAIAKQLSQQNEKLDQLKTLFIGNNAAIASTEVYLDQVSKVITEIYDGSSDLHEAYGKFDQAIDELIEGLSKVSSQLPDLNNHVDKIVKKYSEFDTGLNDYTEAIVLLLSGQQEIIYGAGKLNTGTLSLKNGSSLLYGNMSHLADGTNNLYESTTEIKNNIHALNNQSSHVQANLQTEIDAKILEITGDVSEAISFASSKNGPVKSVQFVFKTKNIKYEEKKTDTSNSKVIKELSLWQKFKALFNFNK